MTMGEASAGLSIFSRLLRIVLRPFFRPKLRLSRKDALPFGKSAGLPYVTVFAYLVLHNDGRTIADHWRLEIRAPIGAQSRIGREGLGSEALSGGRRGVVWRAADFGGSIPPGQDHPLPGKRFEIELYPDESPLVCEYEIRAPGANTRMGTVTVTAEVEQCAVVID